MSNTVTIIGQGLAANYSDTLLSTSGGETGRIQFRDGAFHKDITLTPTGFDGVEGVDWEDLGTI